MKSQLALTLIVVVRLAQAGDPYVRKGYSLVDGSSRNKFIMETGGNTFECDKDCFDDYDDDECDRCTVYGNNNHVYCRKGKVAKSCRQLCCSKYTGGGGGSGQDNDDDFDYGYENYGYEDDDDYDYDDDTDYGYGYGHDNYDRIPDRGEYKWVNTDYSELFDITKNGRKFECSKSCIRDNSNSDCNQCTLYRGWRLKCFKGKISSSCRRECCDQSTNNEIERYFAVDDMYPYDDYNLVTIGPFYNDETYDCRKDCIDQNSGRKCEQCYVDHNIRTWRNLFCIDGEIPSSCRRPCCDKNGGDDEYIEVHDYDPYDSGLVTYHEGSMYWCDTDCIWDKQDGKCDLCRVNRGVVECVEGRVHQGCRRACCEYLSNWRM